MTDAGAAYMVSVRRILEQIDETERVAAGEFHAPRGELVVTAPVLFGRLHILPVVSDFLAAYAEINVRLLLADRYLHLLDDHVDMAVRIGSLPDSSMMATRIGSMRTVVCASPKLLAAHGAPKSPQDLAALPCVNFDFLSPASSWACGAICVAISARCRLIASVSQRGITRAAPLPRPIVPERW